MPKPRTLSTIVAELEETAARVDELWAELQLKFYEVYRLKVLKDPPAATVTLKPRKPLTPEKEQSRRQKLRDAWTRRKEKKMATTEQP